MINPRGTTLKMVAQELTALMRHAPPVRTERWQGKDVRGDPAATSYELRNVCFEVPLRGIEDLDHWRADAEPNLPWADDHFDERVGGQPLNPGRQWANWPWAASADKFRGKDEIFNHTYMERLWPKFARATDRGVLEVGGGPECPRKYPQTGARTQPMRGIAWEYGDLWDLVKMLAKEPGTRQAWVPLFFPEDTGVADGGRKPCTLGYQVIVREGQAHIWYPLRSCDLIRHFRDDCYLAIRLLLWVVESCRRLNPAAWRDVVPGSYAMHMTSLHVFENDRRSL